MSALLYSAFWWQCEECGAEQFIKAIMADLDDEQAQCIAQELFETVDAIGEGDEVKSDYLVTAVAIGPSFVQCENCGKMHATALPENEDA